MPPAIANADRQTGILALPLTLISITLFSYSHIWFFITSNHLLVGFSSGGLVGRLLAKNITWLLLLIVSNS